jgi:phenylpyruvate tautomerase PptA (4-oxalocrotonate tautomerase family)
MPYIQIDTSKVLSPEDQSALAADIVAAVEQSIGSPSTYIFVSIRAQEPASLIEGNGGKKGDGV